MPTFSRVIVQRMCLVSSQIPRSLNETSADNLLSGRDLDKSGYLPDLLVNAPKGKDLCGPTIQLAIGPEGLRSVQTLVILDQLGFSGGIRILPT